ncbi:hypothetical protein F5883DRAFT_180453 [Diaporthe sp. PMI_573]|nr:hypothetical protein F5883DRAFT_180453 [Diaporthaceae sp. PMI_573]
MLASVVALLLTSMFIVVSLAWGLALGLVSLLVTDDRGRLKLSAGTCSLAFPCVSLACPCTSTWPAVPELP